MRPFSTLTLTSLVVLSIGGVGAATLTWDCTRVPNICSNDCYAILCAGKPTTLHRDSANASANRALTACKSPNRCANNPSDSNSCDEYPYASSQEGGKGSVTRCVPATENSRQGGTLSSFYTSNGITDGDAYNVAFASTDGLQYCSGSCTNTGNQLIQRSTVGTQYTTRWFKTDEGHVLTMFERVTNPGELDSLIGTQTWLSHEERNVTIVSALPAPDSSLNSP